MKRVHWKTIALWFVGILLGIMFLISLQQFAFLPSTLLLLAMCISIPAIFRKIPVMNSWSLSQRSASLFGLFILIVFTLPIVEEKMPGAGSRFPSSTDEDQIQNQDQDQDQDQEDETVSSISNVARPACYECHKFKNTPTYTHEPFINGECEKCHTVPESHPSEPATIPTSSETCYQCHDPMDAKEVKHKALYKEKQCMNCHNPHGSNIRSMLKEAAPQLCLKCHDVIKHTSPQPTGSIHAVTVDGKSCLNCHSPHSTKLVRLLKKEPKALCLNCHNKEITTTWDAVERKIPSIQGILDTKTHLHPPFELMDCTTTCHTPHETAQDRLLKLPYPITPHNDSKDSAKSLALCLQCHKKILSPKISRTDTNFRKDVKDKKGRITRTNLHWLHVVNSATNTYNQQGRSCAMCHDPHGTDKLFMLRSSFSIEKLFDNETVKNFQMPIEYVQLPVDKAPTGGQCTKSCHFGSSPHIYERLD